MNELLFLHEEVEQNGSQRGEPVWLSGDGFDTLSWIGGKLFMKLAIFLAVALPMAAAEYTIDSTHSGASFSVRHMMVNTVRGQFSKVTGKISYDAANLAASKVEATIDVSTIDTREAKRDSHLRSPDFFDVARFPVMTFASTKVWREGETVKVLGDLTMHGMTKPITFELSELKTAGARISATATGKLSRREFDLTWNKMIETGGVVVGDEIGLTIEFEAARK